MLLKSDSVPEPYATFRYKVADRVATLTIDNPARRNALTMGTFAEMPDTLARAKVDDGVRVVVLTGAGEQAFSAGADLSSMAASAGHLELHKARGELGRFIIDIWNLGKPTIAKVRGYCLAGGFGVALSCDIVVAAADAVFGTPEIDVGLWPMMITVPLIRAMPPKKALELMMTGRRVSAQEGERLGFVSRVVPTQSLDAAVDELTAMLAEKAPRPCASAATPSTTCWTSTCSTPCASCNPHSRSSPAPKTPPKASSPSNKSAAQSGGAE